MAEPTRFNQYEKDLDAIVHLNPQTEFITSSGQVRQRCWLSQVCISNFKVGSFLGRICKLLGLDYFSFIHKHFDSDLLEASQYVKKTCQLVLAQPSQLPERDKQALVTKTVRKFNELIVYVNDKRTAKHETLLPDEALIKLDNPRGNEQTRRKKRTREDVEKEEAKETYAPPNSPTSQPETKKRRFSLRLQAKRQALT